jgi:hypothetical protein
MTSGDVSESASVRLGGQPAHGAAAARGGLVMIDPARITEVLAVRPVDFATVKRILERLAVSQTFGLDHAVTGRINHLSGDIFILDGAHRSMAVLLGRDRGLPGFAGMLVPVMPRFGSDIRGRIGMWNFDLIVVWPWTALTWALFPTGFFPKSDLTL